MSRRPPTCASERRGAAFTLVELLVVLAVIALLAALILPGLTSARLTSQRTACAANLRSIGQAIQVFAIGNNGRIPFGPKAPPPMTASDFYPATGVPTSLISFRDGRPVGLGLLLPGPLAGRADLFFCPGADQPRDAALELAKAGRGQSQGAYYYRHASVTRRFDPPGLDVMTPDTIRLDDLGLNRNGLPIRALALDTQFVVTPEFGAFGIRSRTHHRQRWTNVLYADGSALARSNADGRYRVSFDTHADLLDAFGVILRAFERADEIEGPER